MRLVSLDKKQFRCANKKFVSSLSFFFWANTNASKYDINSRYANRSLLMMFMFAWVRLSTTLRSFLAEKNLHQHNFSSIQIPLIKSPSSAYAPECSQYKFSFRFSVSPTIKILPIKTHRLCLPHKKPQNLPWGSIKNNFLGAVSVELRILSYIFA